VNRLLIDIGNTSLKAAWLEGGQLLPLQRQRHESDPLSAFASLAVPRAPRDVWVVHVVDRELEPAIEDLVRLRWSCRVHFARSEHHRDGLSNAYLDPAKLGADRWVAMVAAWRQHRGAAIVVDAGTALTVDAIDAQGRHCGGLIIAGLATAQNALLGKTHFGARVAGADARWSGGRSLGDDTESCVRQGAVHALCGTIERIWRQFPASAGLMTGGDADELHPLVDGNWSLQPDLVLEGLAGIASAADPPA